jgi:hypothetical protein
MRPADRSRSREWKGERKTGHLMLKSLFISYSKFTGHLILKSLDIVNVLRGEEREEDAAPNSEKSAFTTQQCEAVRFWNLSSTRSSAPPP